MMRSCLRYGAFAGFLAVQCVSVGCGSGKGNVTLQFTNTATTALSMTQHQEAPTIGQPPASKVVTTSAATSFKMKLIAAYLTEDIDATTQNNVGNTAMIYLNSDCADDIMHCDISAGTAEDGASMSHVVTSFFNFGQPSASVNAALNAQSREIDEGTYKYARLEFCKYNSGNSENVEWQGGSASGTQSFKRNSCTVNSAVISPAIEVKKGDSVTITLAYDYSTAIQTGDTATGDHCDPSTVGTSNKTCFTLPTFTPSASK